MTKEQMAKGKRIEKELNAINSALDILAYPEVASQRYNNGLEYHTRDIRITISGYSKASTIGEPHYADYSEELPPSIDLVYGLETVLKQRKEKLETEFENL